MDIIAKNFREANNIHRARALTFPGFSRHVGCATEIFQNFAVHAVLELCTRWKYRHMRIVPYSTWYV